MMTAQHFCCFVPGVDTAIPQDNILQKNDLMNFKKKNLCIPTDSVFTGKHCLIRRFLNKSALLPDPF